MGCFCRLSRHDAVIGNQHVVRHRGRQHGPFFVEISTRKTRENLPPEDAVRYAFHTVGNALIITTSTLIIGFLALATSSFSLNADMGLLTAVVIAVALAAVFLLLPPLSLKIKEKNSAASPGAPSTGTLTAG